jgi:hypothetical protein
MALSIQDVYTLFNATDLVEARNAALTALVEKHAPDGQPFTREDFDACDAAIEARKLELNPPKASGAPSMGIKVSEKKAVSVYGLQRWPVTLYASAWIRLLLGDKETRTSTAYVNSTHPVIVFIRDNANTVSWERAK